MYVCFKDVIFTDTSHLYFDNNTISLYALLIFRVCLILKLKNDARSIRDPWFGKIFSIFTLFYMKKIIPHAKIEFHEKTEKCNRKSN